VFSVRLYLLPTLHWLLVTCTVLCLFMLLLKERCQVQITYIRGRHWVQRHSSPTPKMSTTFFQRTILTTTATLTTFSPVYIQRHLMPSRSVHGFNSILATSPTGVFQAAGAQRRKNRAHVVRLIGGDEQSSVTIRYDVEQRGRRYTTGDNSS